MCDTFSAMPAVARTGSSAAVANRAAATSCQRGAPRGHANGRARTAADGNARHPAAQSVRPLQGNGRVVLAEGSWDGHRHVQRVRKLSQEKRVPPAAAGHRSRTGEP